MSKKKKLPKGLPKKFVPDAKVLEEQLKETHFRETVKNLLRMVYDDRLSLTFFDFYIERICGEAASRIITYTLQLNDISFIDELRETEISKEVLDFLIELVSEFGSVFRLFRKKLTYPDEFVRVIWNFCFNFDHMEPVLRATIQKRSEEEVMLEGPADSFLRLATYILSRLAQLYAETKKNMPEIKPFYKKKDIDEIEKSLQKLNELRQS